MHFCGDLFPCVVVYLLATPLIRHRHRHRYRHRHRQHHRQRHRHRHHYRHHFETMIMAIIVKSKHQHPQYQPWHHKC